MVAPLAPLWPSWLYSWGERSHAHGSAIFAPATRLCATRDASGEPEKAVAATTRPSIENAPGIYLRRYLRSSALALITSLLLHVARR
jgi:hypothetical protein